LYIAGGVVFSCWFGAILCGMSLACVFIVMPLDKYMDKKLAASELSDESVKAALLVNKVSNDPEEDMVGVNGEHGDAQTTAVSVRDVLKFTLIFWVISLSCVTVYGEFCHSSRLVSQMAPRTG
jgi:hypothetical protein